MALTREQFLAQNRARRSALLGTSRFVSAEQVRDLGPDEPRKGGGGGGGGLFGIGIGPDFSAGDLAQALFETGPALGGQTALSVIEAGLNPLSSLTQIPENFLRSAGVNLNLPDLNPFPEIRVPGTLDRGAPLDPTERGRAARRKQDEDLSQDLLPFELPLLGNVTPSGLLRVAADPLNVIPLPVGLVGRVAGGAATRTGVRGATERVVGSAGRAIFPLGSRKSIPGQALSAARGGVDAVKVAGPAAGAIKAGARKVVTRSRQTLPEATIRKFPNFIRANSAEDLGKSYRASIDAQRSLQTGIKNRIPGLKNRIPDQIQSTFNRMRPLLRSTDITNDDLLGLGSEIRRISNAQESLVSLAANDFGRLMSIAKISIRPGARQETTDGVTRYYDEVLQNGKQIIDPKTNKGMDFETLVKKRRTPGVQEKLTPATIEMMEVLDGYLLETNDFLLQRGLTKREVLDTAFEDFFPRRVIGKNGNDEILSGSFNLTTGQRIGPKVGRASVSSLDRKFQYSSQAVRAGFNLESNPVSVLQAYMRGTFHEGLDDYVETMVQSMVSKPLRTALNEAEERFGRKLTSEEIESITKANAPSGGVGTIKIGGTTVSADTGKAVLDELGLGLEQTALGNMGAKLDAFNNIFRPLMVTGDLAGAMIQGGMSAFTNTAGWMKAMGIATSSLFDPHIMEGWARRNADLIDMGIDRFGLIQVGDNVGSEFIFKAPARVRKVANWNNIFGSAVRAGGKPFKFANLHFSRFGNVLRTENLRAVLKQEELIGRQFTADESLAIGKVLNNATGVGEKGLFGKGDSAVVFAPRFFRSQLDLITNAVVDGTVAGDLAREQLSRFFVLGTMTTKFINDAAGEETIFDPSDPNFLRIRAFGADISIFGPYDTLFRAVGKIPDQGVVEAASQLAQGKASPAISQLLDLWKGETFSGRQIGFDSLDEVAGLVENLSIGQAPISIVGGAEAGIEAARGEISIGSAIGRAGLETLGAKLSPLSLSDKLKAARNAAARVVSNGEVGDYDALVNRVGASRARELTRQTADVQKFEAERTKRNLEEAAEGNDSFEDYFASLESINEESHRRERELEQAVLDGRATGTQFREALKEVNIARRGAASALSDQFAPVIAGFSQSESPVDIATSQFYELMDQARDPTGKVDQGYFDVLLEGFERKIGSEMFAAVEGNTGHQAETDLGNELRQAQKLLSPFFSAREGFFQSLKQRDPQLAQFQSLSQLETQLRITAMRIDPRDPDKIEKRLRSRISTLRRIDSLTKRYKDRMKKADPRVSIALDRFYS